MVGVGGSNPLGCTKQKALPFGGAFLLKTKVFAVRQKSLFEL